MSKKLKFGPDEGINFDQPPVQFAGFDLWTYGNYGGPYYAAGEYSSAGANLVPANFVANVNAMGQGYYEDINITAGEIYIFTARGTLATQFSAFDAFVGRDLPVSGTILAGFQQDAPGEFVTALTNYDPVTGTNVTSETIFGEQFAFVLTGSFINDITINGGENSPVPLLANVVTGAKLTSFSITAVSQLATDPELYQAVQPIDPLDALFRFHDMAYDPGISGFDPEARAEADVDLIRGISHIPNGHLDAEAAIYAGLATLVTIATVETGSHSELLSDRENVRYATGALKDIQRGLDDLTPAELQVTAPIVEAAVQNIFSLFDFGLA